MADANLPPARLEHFQVNATSRGATISFRPGDTEAICAFHKAFPKARYQAGYRQWFLRNSQPELEAQWELLAWAKAYVASFGPKADGV